MSLTNLCYLFDECFEKDAKKCYNSQEIAKLRMTAAPRKQTDTLPNYVIRLNVKITVDLKINNVNELLEKKETI